MNWDRLYGYLFGFSFGICFFLIGIILLIVFDDYRALTAVPFIAVACWFSYYFLLIQAREEKK